MMYNKTWQGNNFFPLLRNNGLRSYRQAGLYIVSKRKTTPTVHCAQNSEKDASGTLFHMKKKARIFRRRGPEQAHFLALALPMEARRGSLASIQVLGCSIMLCHAMLSSPLASIQSTCRPSFTTPAVHRNRRKNALSLGIQKKQTTQMTASKQHSATNLCTSDKKVKVQRSKKILKVQGEKKISKCWGKKKKEDFYLGFTLMIACPSWSLHSNNPYKAYK